MKAIRFRVWNFRNIDDSGWISLERVTAFVGRNESGKTSLLRALHKFNPATPEAYDAQREFPRDRYTRDYIANGSKGADWPVCSVEFCVPKELQTEFSELLEGQSSPATVTMTRYYDGTLGMSHSPEIVEPTVSPEPVLKALGAFASGARRLGLPEPGNEEVAAAHRKELAQWATKWQDTLRERRDLRDDKCVGLLTSILNEVEGKSEPQTADILAAIAKALESVERTGRNS